MKSEILKSWNTYMQRCLQLAANGRGFVSPNPMVGCVIVYNGRIIGEGYHRAYGQAHAEVNAITSVKDKELLADATLYVNLEPCSHHGKTPPCADLIIGSGIPRVVVGMQDPFPEVAGRGINRLREHGVEVKVGVLEEECRWLNRRFITYNTLNRPYIILKWAQSADGFMDIVRQENDGQEPVQFSNDFTQIMVHKLRAGEDAIIIGSNTARLDKPRLNVRYWDGKDPRRLIADSRKTLAAQLQELYDGSIQSLIVEGGAKLLASFIEEGYWDEARIEIAISTLNAGIKAPFIDGTLINTQKYRESTVLTYLSSRQPV